MKTTLFVLILFLTACGGAKSNSKKTSIALTGSVLDIANNQPIAGADVYLANQHTQTNVSGYYQFNQVDANQAALRVSKINYATRIFPLQLSSSNVNTANNLMLFMKAVELNQNVTLPAVDQNAAVVQLIRDNTIAMTLMIPSQSLLTPDHVVASGNVTVQMTFFDANDNFALAPLMYAVNSNFNDYPQSLQTYGMAYIEIFQDNAALTVNPGKQLLWSVQQPNETMTAFNADSNQIPAFYSFDENINLWVLDGNTSYDSNTGLLSANLAHLSHFNFDSVKPQYGTCYSGKVINQCGKPVVSQNVYVGLSNGTGRFGYVIGQTDVSGTYCANAVDIGNSNHYPVAIFPYVLSTLDPNATHTCHPAGAIDDSCFTNSSWTSGYDTLYVPANCPKNVSLFNRACFNNRNFIVYQSSCTSCPGISNIENYQYDIYRNCASIGKTVTTNIENCAHIHSITIHDGTTCTSDVPGCTTPKAEGAACINTQDCCNSLYACYDQQCVPISDVPYL